MLKIGEDIYWVGALDPNIRVFDIIMKADRGTTYNSYLIKGTRKTALVEAVKKGFLDQLYRNLEGLCAPEEIDYIIINHNEPDHTGALKELLKRASKAKVVVSSTGKSLLRGILKEEISPLQMREGDVLSLGSKTLEFIPAPFLHWPDTMFTYVREDGILFPCDAFGCHYADERMFDDLVDDFNYAFRYYFDHIMRPFKEYVLKATDKLADKNIEIIAPSHGPILRNNPRKYIDYYQAWSISEREDLTPVLAIFYLSAYGNTAQMAEHIGKGAQAAGLKVEIMDIVGIDISAMQDLVERACGVLVGSPTINRDAVKPAWDLLSSLATINLRGKIGGAFGSYGWSGEAVPMLLERMRSLQFKIVEPGIKANLIVDENDLKNSFEYGQKIAQEILKTS